MVFVTIVNQTYGCPASNKGKCCGRTRNAVIFTFQYEHVIGWYCVLKDLFLFLMAHGKQERNRWIVAISTSPNCLSLRRHLNLDTTYFLYVLNGNLSF